MRVFLLTVLLVLCVYLTAPVQARESSESSLALTPRMRLAQLRQRVVSESDAAPAKAASKPKATKITKPKPVFKNPKPRVVKPTTVKKSTKPKGPAENYSTAKTGSQYYSVRKNGKFVKKAGSSTGGAAPAPAPAPVASSTGAAAAPTAAPAPAGPTGPICGNLKTSVCTELEDICCQPERGSSAYWPWINDAQYVKETYGTWAAYLRHEQGWGGNVLFSYLMKHRPERYKTVQVKVPLPPKKN